VTTESSCEHDEVPRLRCSYCGASCCRPCRPEHWCDDKKRFHEDFVNNRGTYVGEHGPELVLTGDPNAWKNVPIKTTLYQRLLAATSDPIRRILTERMVRRPLGALRAVVELHSTHEGRCTACIEWCDCHDTDPFMSVTNCPHGNVKEPCPTKIVIARALNVEIGETS
jgi:hypothetical protein